MWQRRRLYLAADIGTPATPHTTGHQKARAIRAGYRRRRILVAQNTIAHFCQGYRCFGYHFWRYAHEKRKSRDTQQKGEQSTPYLARLLPWRSQKQLEKQHLAGHVEGVPGFARCSATTGGGGGVAVCPCFSCCCTTSRPTATGVHRFQVAPTTFQTSIAAREMYVHFWAVSTICPSWSLSARGGPPPACLRVSTLWWLVPSQYPPARRERRLGRCCLPTGPAPPPAIS